MKRPPYNDQEQEPTEKELEQRYIELLQQMLSAGDFTSALSFCQSILNYNPHHPRFNFECGVIQLKFGNYDLAKQLFITSAKNSTHPNPICLFNIGYISYFQNNYDEAILFYERALKACASDEDAKRAYEKEHNIAVISIDNLEKWQIYQNLSAAYNGKAHEVKNTDLAGAYALYQRAAETCDQVMNLPNSLGEKNASWVDAYYNKMRVLFNQVKLDAKLERPLSTLEILKQMLDNAEHLQELSTLQRDIRKLRLALKHFDGEWVDTDAILQDEHHEQQQAADQIAEKLKSIVDWHREPVDWPAIFDQEQRALESAIGVNEAQPPKLKSSKVVREENKPATSDNSKLNRLWEEHTKRLQNPALFPHSFAVILSSPEFLQFRGMYMFEAGRLPHVIAESYTFFDALVANFYQHKLIAIECQLQRAGNLVSVKKYNVDPLLQSAQEMLAQLGTPDHLCFFGQVIHVNEPEIQTIRRRDFMNVARFHLARVLFKQNLFQGLVFQLRNDNKLAEDHFNACYPLVSVLEDIFNDKHNTEQLCALKDQYHPLKVMTLISLIREHQEKIPRQLFARIQQLESLYRKDPMRIQIGDYSIPFPYDMFARDFNARKRQKAPENANMTDHVLTLCYENIQGEKKIISIKFDMGEPILALENSAHKFDTTYGLAQQAVVKKINHGLSICFKPDIESAKACLDFKKKVDYPTVTYDRGLHEHSEQVFYFELDHVKPHKLIVAFEKASNQDLVRGCNILGIVSEMQSTKTCCPSCKCSAIATQNPKPDDREAFLHNLQTAFLQKGYRIRGNNDDRYQLFMATRIIAFSPDRFRSEGLVHKNPAQQHCDLSQLKNLGILEEMDSSSCVSGYRKALSFL
ncbi:MAG: tetratricopeptide repeat protein [Gammaproteobacteria bacterium]|nr:tetratricopeptide repeat protein [Gammaproteobacteria bacterium]